MEPGSGRQSLLGTSLLVLAPSPATLSLVLERASPVSFALGRVRDVAGERPVREVLELKGTRCVGAVVVVVEGRR